MRHTQLLIAALAVFMAASATAQTVQLRDELKINPRDLQHQRVPEQFRPKHLELKIKVPQKLRVTSSNMSVYAVPFDGWCRNDPGGETEGRIWVSANLPNEAGSPNIAATVEVNVSGRVQRDDIVLRPGDNSISAGPFRVPAAEICSDRCVDYRIMARDSAHAGQVNTPWMQACIR